MAKNISKTDQRRMLIEGINELKKFKDPMILGIDPSRTSCGWAIYKTPRLKKFASIQPDKSLTTFKKVVAVSTEITSIMEKYKPDFVIMEDYAYGASQGRELAGEVQGVIMMSIFARELPLIKPAVTQVKAFIGADRKSNIMMEVLSRYGFKTQNDDQADAIVLALIGDAIFRVISNLPKAFKNIDPSSTKIDKKFKEVSKDLGLNINQSNTIYKLILKKGKHIWL